VRPTPRDIAARLTRASAYRPLVALAFAGALGMILLWQATRLTSEVGYAAYFGPDHPAVEGMQGFLEEFGSGFHALVAFSCNDTHVCERVTEIDALELLSDLHSELDTLPNVRSTHSVLNAPILVDPLDTRTLAERNGDGRYRLVESWPDLVARLDEQPFLTNTVISRDLRTAGLVVELQSLDSVPVRRAVHAIREVVERYETQLGAEIYLAGDPVWTVLSDDSLDADSRTLTVVMFAVILGVLWAIFRDLRLTLLPVLAVGVLTVAVHGLIALLGFPMTSIMAALPPLLVVIAITSSIHLLSAFLRHREEPLQRGLVRSAREVGEGCFWATATTAGGFASFLWSDLESFRHFGLVAALGMALALVVTFGLLPALLVVTRSSRPRGAPRERTALLDELLEAVQQTVIRHRRFVLGTGIVLLVVLIAGIPRLRYDTEFGDQSFILRSVRFMEQNLRKPMTTELVVTLPAGANIYDERSLRLLHRLEEYFDRESSTGYVWSFLDYLEEAYRVDHGRPPPSFGALIEAAPRTMPLVAARERVSAFWSESLSPQGDRTARRGDRARISVHRAWLDDDAQGPYLDRLRAFVSSMNDELRPEGYHVAIEGGLVLSDLAVRRIRETQVSSFASAFAVVTLVLGFLLRRSPALLGWGVVVNVLPVLALLGIMGWVDIGVGPANTMVAALLLAIAVDDTVHVALRYRRERLGGASPEAAVARTLATVGRPIVITSVCLALGFSVLMLSEWGGLVSFGMLASLGVILALAADLLLLPAGLLRGTPGISLAETS